MKKYVLLFISIIYFFTHANAQTWEWTKPEPNGNLTYSAEDDYAHDVEVDALGNVFVLGDYAGSLFLNDIYRATGSGSYLAKYDAAGNLIWYKLIVKTSSSGNIRATDFTINAEGIFITGKYDPTGKNGGVTSYDCNGGGTGSVYSYSIGDFNFNSGFYNEAGFFVTKFNTDGGVVWNKLATGQVCFDTYNASLYFVDYNPLITSDKNNNIICEFLFEHTETKRTSLNIGGNSIPLPLPPPGNNTLIVFKMNSSGNLLWSNYALNPIPNNYSSVQDCNSIVADNNGDIFLYGHTSDGCAFGSNIFQTNNYLQNGINGNSTFIAKISSTGVWQFAKELANHSSNILGEHMTPDFLATDDQNNLYALVTTFIQNTTLPTILGETVPVDKTLIYLVKLNNNGDLIWKKGFGSNYGATGRSVHFVNNALYISGMLHTINPWYFSNLTVQPTTGTQNYEYYVSKANTDGDFQWVTSFSGPYSVMEGFALSAFNDNVYTSGYYKGHITTLGNLSGTYNDPLAIKNNLFLGKLKDQYIRVGAVSPTTVCPGGNITISFTSFGLTFSATNTFTAQLSDANGSFSNPASIGSVVSTGTGSITATLPNISPGSTGYLVRIASSDFLNTGLPYYAYADLNYVITAGQQTFYQDMDQDGFGNPAVSTTVCPQPAGYVSNNTDNCPSIYNPDQADTDNDGIGDACENSIRINSSLFPFTCPGASFGIQYIATGTFNAANIFTIQLSDGGGSFANPLIVGSVVATVSGNITCNLPNNLAAGPGYRIRIISSAPVLVSPDNGTDLEIKPMVTYYRDADGDGYGTTGNSLVNCFAITGYVISSGDCNDNDNTVYPGATEACDDKDNDCNGLTDEGVTTTYYLDADGDGFGNTASATQACSQPDGYVTIAGDCNDSNAAINPVVVEACGNSIDDNCNGQVDEGCTTPPIISINDITVYESQGVATLTVSLSNTNTQPTKINYTTNDGTAISKVRGRNPVIDYIASKGSLIIPAGSLTGTISITIINDGLIEPSEYFDVLLSLARNVNATIGDGSGRVIILDGNAPITAANRNSFMISENKNNSFDVKLFNNPTHDQFDIMIQSGSNERIIVRVIDMHGRVIEIKEGLSTNQSYRFGNRYVAGTYFAEVIQGDKRRTVKVIKQ